VRTTTHPTHSGPYRVGTTLLVACGLLLAVSMASATALPTGGSVRATSASSPLAKLPPSVYVTYGSNVSVVNSSNVVTHTILIKGKNPGPEYLTYCQSKVFVSDVNVGRISVISPSSNKLLKTISGFTVPGFTYCLSGLLWVEDSTFVKILNATTYKVVHSINESASSFGFSPATKELYIDNQNGSISIYNPSTFKRVAQLSGAPDSGYFAYNPVKKDLYLTNPAGYPTASLMLISSSNHLTQLNFSSSCGFSKALTGIAYSPATKDMYVGCLIDNNFEGTVIVLNATTDAIVTTISVGYDTGGIAYDASNMDIYAASPENLMGSPPGVLAVIGHTNTLLKSINVGNEGSLAVS
jgi:hypothetical protein